MNKERLPLDPAFMDVAIELAKKSNPSPNPRVGAVIVKDRKIVGRGFHERPGLPHAEIVALNDTGISPNGTDLYVTLEPCCHQGKTGPCVDEIIAAGISRVAIGICDPDHRVNKKGISLLEQAGIEVFVGIQKKECQKILHGYIVHRTLGRPLVTLKAAMTLDGAIASISGDSKWISNEASRQISHEMRAESDAILVGIETVLNDDPLLTVRHCKGKNPLRIVMDSKLRIPIDSKLVTSAADTPVLLAHCGASLKAIQTLENIEGVEVLHCTATHDGLVDPKDLLKKLGKRGILSLLVEGGSKIHGSFAHSNMADKVALFVAPKILGSGLPWISFSGASTVADGLSLADFEVTSIKDNLLIEGHFSKGN